jgi:acyl dehydratase
MNPNSITVGTQLPDFVRRSDFDAWNRYAAVNDEFVPIHMDDAAGQAAGYPGAIGMGNLIWAYMHNAIHDWLGDDADIESLSCQFRAANLRGSTVIIRGLVRESERRDDATVVSIDVTAASDRGVVLAPGTAMVRLAG